MILINDFDLTQPQKVIVLDHTLDETTLLTEILALCKTADPELIVAESKEADLVLRLLPEIHDYCGAIALKQPLCNDIDFDLLSVHYVTRSQAERSTIQIQLAKNHPDYTKLDGIFYMLDEHEDFDQAVELLKNSYFFYADVDNLD
ncbi:MULTISPECIES: hypothetical protein [unclassified Acinetobacter]|uniref:hypothetical protein n=1 Tax=unclassified Acinetobacter TaxID=196816 RepID=UPI0015D3FB7E|nr:MULTISPECIES: hypothetical protein [unclassified Acinetobacter]